jgi:hypothetical protein
LLVVCSFQSFRGLWVQVPGPPIGSQTGEDGERNSPIAPIVLVVDLPFATLDFVLWPPAVPLVGGRVPPVVVGHGSPLPHARLKAG